MARSIKIGPYESILCQTLQADHISSTLHHFKKMEGEHKQGSCRGGAVRRRNFFQRTPEPSFHRSCPSEAMLCIPFSVLRGRYAVHSSILLLASLAYELWSGTRRSR